jgi:hypothetical protein
VRLPNQGLWIGIESSNKQTLVRKCRGGGI